MKKLTRQFLVMSAGAVGMLVSTVGTADTLTDVRERNSLRCGVSQGVPGFSNPVGNGQWAGIDADICRAIAAAVLGDGSLVEFVSLAADQRFDALNAKQVDVLTRNTTWSYSRDTELDLSFAAISYFDGQAFMVNAATGITSVSDLDGASICVTTDTTSQDNLADFFRSKKLHYTEVANRHPDLALVSYSRGNCDAFSGDLSALAGHRLKLDIPDNHLILPEIIAKEPHGLVVRHGDDRWQDIVRWSFYALVVAEEYDVSRANVDEKSTNGPPEVLRLLGTEGAYGKMLGLADDWAAAAIKAVGNYAEIYDRNVGEQTAIALSRGINALWRDGGLIYAPPFR